MAKIISLINQKGGVGKTTSTNAITVCLKHKGYRTLCVDFNPQSHLTFSMGIDGRDCPTIYEVIKHEIKCKYAIQKGPIADIIPTDGLLSSIEREFTSKGCERLLQDALKTISGDYDYILIDSPPELGLLSSNAIVASDIVLIPGLADGYSLQGLIQVHDMIMRIKNAFNPDLAIAGMFLVRYYPREALSKTIHETAQMIADHLNITLMDSYIRHSNIICKAMTSLQKDIIDYAPKNNAVKDYQSLVDELFERGIF